MPLFFYRQTNQQMKFSTKGKTPKAESYPDLKQLDQIELWSMVLSKRYNLGDRFSNPYRHDRNADCYLWLGRDGIVRISDFPWREIHGKDVISFAAIVWGCHPLQAVWRLTKGQVLPVYVNSEITLRSHTPIMRWKICPWRKADRVFWQAYGISKAQLEREKTFAINKIWLNKRNSSILFDIPCKAPASVTILGQWQGKVYRPSNEDRFFTTIPSGTLMGAKGNKGRKRAIVTKFVKDKLVLNNCGEDSFFVNGETDIVTPSDISALTNTYERIIHLTDADDAGRNAALYLNEIYDNYKGIRAMPMPQYKNCSDPSDVILNHSGTDLEYILSNL